MSTSEVPLSESAQDAKEVMQQELLRSMAKKMMATAIEDERQRRIKELEELQKPEVEDSIKKNAYEQLMVVQEDLVRTMNLMKVKSEAECEKAQRETEDKKKDVHAELVRKAAAKEVNRAMDDEKERRMNRDKSEFDQEKKEVHEKLIVVQEDLLKTLRKMKVDEEMRLEQERRVLEGKKNLVHQQLVKSVNEKAADSLMEEEKKRRMTELGEDEIHRRVAIANKFIDVQKELLATHKEVKGISGTVSQAVLEETKAFYQEQLLRKAAQAEAITAMDEEKERRIAEGTNHTLSDPQAMLLEDINRQSNIKKAKEQADNTQKEYIQADNKARAQEETVRKFNQKMANLAMDAEKEERMMEDKPRQPIQEAMKKEIESHSN